MVRDVQAQAIESRTEMPSPPGHAPGSCRRAQCPMCNEKYNLCMRAALHAHNASTDLRWLVLSYTYSESAHYSCSPNFKRGCRMFCSFVIPLVLTPTAVLRSTATHVRPYRFQYYNNIDQRRQRVHTILGFFAHHLRIPLPHITLFFSQTREQIPGRYRERAHTASAHATRTQKRPRGRGPRGRGRGGV